jgi:preprotein translocase subunit SecD
VLNFPRWKILSIIGVCLIFALLAMPNIFSENAREKWPAFLPTKTVNLGLDLQGGSYLLLELQFDRYFHEQLTSTLDDLRAKFIAKRIMYQGLSIAKDKQDKEVVRFTLLKKPTDDVNIKDIIREAGLDLEIRDTGSNNYEVAFTDSAARLRKQQLLDQSIQIVNRRVNETGTREPLIQRQGDNRIVLQVPGLQDPERLKILLGKTAKMAFHLVDESVDINDAMHGKVPPGTRILYGDEKEVMSNGKPVPYAIKSRVMLGGDMLVDASPTFDGQTNEPVVSFRFNTQGAQHFGEITRDNVGKRFAVVLDDKVITAPVIRSAILGGTGIISGRFTAESANDLAVLLRAGALPAPLKIIEERSVGPSLGADSIGAGKRASLLGVILVMGFMLINYGLFGIFADIALLVNLIFIMGALSLFQATLTLPGIAGMVLTLGMAVDANVLIYERIREELRNGKSPFAAIDHGFRIARGTILDSNVTTLIAAILLFYFGAGTVKGFAVTLAIGILASMFTAILLTRLMIAVWLRRTKPKVVPI